jgi:hypothetical protein
MRAGQSGKGFFSSTIISNKQLASREFSTVNP